MLMLKNRKFPPICKVFNFVATYTKPNLQSVKLMADAFVTMVPELHAKYGSSPPLTKRVYIAKRLAAFQAAYLRILKLFYRKGLYSQTSKLFFKVLLLYKKLYLKKKLIKKGKYITIAYLFKEVNKIVNEISVPLKLVPRFIKRRVRKFPKIVEPEFQQNRVWRTLRSLGRIAYGKAASNIAEELHKLSLKQKTSVVLSKLPKYYEDINKSKVYLRKIRYRHWDYSRASSVVKNMFKSIFSHRSAYNAYYLRMLTFARLANEPKAERYTLSKHLHLRKKLYYWRPFRSRLNRFFAVLYGYVTTPNYLRRP